MHVLLLGDYPPLVKALQRGLEEEGYTVAVARVSQGPAPGIPDGGYDAIIVDLARPAVVAESPWQRWRAAGFRSPVLVLAPEKINYQGQGWDPGPDTWLTKPFAWEQLLARLRAVGGRQERTAVPGRVYHAGCCPGWVSSS